MCGIDRVLNRYGVTFRVMHGYESATAIHDIADESSRADKPLTIFYVGDFDPSGMHMSEADIPNRITRYDGSVNIRRIALTGDDIRSGTDLPSFDAATKTGDSRYRWFVSRYGDQCWELDAMSPVALRQRVEDEIVALIDQEAWDRALIVEKAEVDSMKLYGEQWKSSILRQAPKYSYAEGAIP